MLWTNRDTATWTQIEREKLFNLLGNLVSQIKLEVKKCHFGL